MKITTEQVIQKWAEFAAWTNRAPLGPPMIHQVYEYLQSRLTAEELNQACRLWVMQSPFMPAPAQLVELIRGSSEDAAVQDWEKIYSACSDSDRGVEGLTEVGKRALRLVGGLRVVGHAQVGFELDSLRRQFFRYHKTYWKESERIDFFRGSLSDGMHGLLGEDEDAA